MLLEKNRGRTEKEGKTEQHKERQGRTGGDRTGDQG